MPRQWSMPPETLPDPQEVSIRFYRPWTTDPEDAAGVGGTLQFGTSGPGGTSMQALNAFIDTLTSAGWIAQAGSATQQVTRELVETDPAA